MQPALLDQRAPHILMHLANDSKCGPQMSSINSTQQHVRNAHFQAHPGTLIQKLWTQQSLLFKQALQVILLQADVSEPLLKSFAKSVDLAH